MQLPNAFPWRIALSIHVLGMLLDSPAARVLYACMDHTILHGKPFGIPLNLQLLNPCEGPILRTTYTTYSRTMHSVTAYSRTMDNLQYRLIFHLGKSRQKRNSRKERFKSGKLPKFGRENVVKYGKYSIAKFANIPCFCITCGNC